ncbi:UDP-galactopyranose mutase [Mucilaginibacter gossypiicola]|uniref:UDP-galactopyranose mutase n=1 Tax=Mucilaginibacter gossypiicola TaxID=551995 RepID=A0A1H8BA01_9SPHI|nr:UDP-galactopyranose mutase [Mucilaginibacter gossypiicola]SEM79536.1 UDP-galactopyranose mutase [Mucilaginibacter gossypiicola]
MAVYDYLIVGAGLFGAVFAREMTDAGRKCLVIDKRCHAGGNVYCEQIEGINVHKYGPHIFHTNDRTIWEYVNSFVPFNHFIYSPLAEYQGVLYNMPFNMNTFYQMWKVKTPQEAMDKIAEQVKEAGIIHPNNLEEQAISMVGVDIYNKLIKGYTEKQWGRKAIDLPKFIIKRLPVRFNYDNNYFNDTYQGIPVGGYNKLIDGLLSGVEVRLNCDFFKNRNEVAGMANAIVYTGKLDEFYDYKFGLLEYRSLRFEHEVLGVANYQGVAIINSTDIKVPYTRTIEHKHFEFGTQSKTVITREFSDESSVEKEAYYPINDVRNEEILKKYVELSKLEQNVIFGGRLAEYKYYDMHQVIAAALKKARHILNKQPVGAYQAKLKTISV